MSFPRPAHASRNKSALPLGLVAVLTIQLLSTVALQSIAAPALAQAPAGSSPAFGQEGAPDWNVFHGPPGSEAFEPSIGYNWNTGNAMYIAEGTSSISAYTVFRISFTDGAGGATADWQDSGAQKTIPHILLDPILYTDPISGRTYAGDIQATCTELQYTDDDGLSGWTDSTDSCSFTGADHETIGSGPWANDPVTGSNPPERASYPRAVYDCAQSQTMQCGISYDGGDTFTPLPAPDPTHNCGGLHGHLRVSPDGTANVPNKNCNGMVGILSTHNNGLTWDLATAPGSTNAGSFDPSLAPTPGNWLYVGQAYNNGAFVGMTKDYGLGWQDVGTANGAAAGTKWFNVASLDPAIRNTEFAEMIAGDNERAAFAFLGQTAVGAGDPHTCSSTSNLEWYMYVAMTYDAGQSWSLQKVTTDPVQRNGISDGGTTGDQTCRNMADFNDITVDADGRVLVAFTDGCPDPCAGRGSTGTLPGLVRQFSGKGLFAAHDANSTPTNPAITIVSPSEGANVAPGTLPVLGTVDRNAGQQVPTLVAHANGPYVALTGTAIALTGTHSGGDSTQAYTCAWSDDGGGVYDDASSCTAHVTFASAGDFQLTLTVHNGAASATDTATASITAGHIHGSLFAYQTTPVALPPNPAVAQYPGVGVSNVLATVTALAGDPVPKFPGGTWVTVSVRSAASTDVSIGTTTPVVFTLTDADGAVVEGPFTATGKVDSSGGFQYSYAPIVIPCTSGRYYLVAVATVGSSSITISNDGSPDGKAPLDVIAAPASLPQCPVGTTSGVLDPALPVHTLSASTGSPAADYYFHGTNPVGNGDTFPMPMTTVAPTASDPKVVYAASLDGTNRPNFIYDAADWQTPGAITLDHQDLKATWWIAPGPKSGTESVLVPSTWEIVLFKDGVAFKTVDPAIAGPTAPMVGPTELSYTIPDVSMASGRLGILIDPHYTDTVDSPILYDAVSTPSRLHISGPAGALAVDAGGPYSGGVGDPVLVVATTTGGTAPVSCAWTGAGATFTNANACTTAVRFFTAGSKTITVTATDSAATPATASDSATVNVGSAGKDYYFHGTQAIGNGDTFPMPMDLTAPTGSTPKVVYAASLDGTNRPNFIYDAADWQTSSPITLDHQDLKATWWILPGPKSGTESVLVPSTWEIVLFRNGVAFQSVDEVVAGPTAVMVGPTELSVTIPDVSMDSGNLGILIDPFFSDTVDSPILYDAVSTPSRLHVSAPTGPGSLSVDAGGPYSGAIGSAIAIAATVTGGTAPVSCAWTGANATFADASACSTTVSYSTAGGKTLTVTATDSTSPTPATATDTATVTVASSSVERVELYVDGVANGPAIPVSTSQASPTASWSGAVDLTGLSGFHTITAKWFDAGVESTGTPLATDSVNVTVQQATGTPFVEITNPSSDGQTRDFPATFNGTYSTDGHSPSTTASSQAFNPDLMQLLQDPHFGAATLSLRNLPGFVAAVPVPDAATPTLSVGLSGPVPAHAPASVAGWQVRYTPGVKVDPLVGHTDQAVKALSVDEALARMHAAKSAPSGPYLPGPNAADGIGPGSAIFFPIGADSEGLCSASFLLRDPSTLKYYLATAGHCLLQAEAGPATSGYDTPGAVWPEIDVCFEGCIENWNLLLGNVGTYVAFHASADNSYNPVAFAQAQGVGQDIGLIEIPASAEPLLRPYLPEWGGPVDYQEPALGDLLVHYGHGAYCCPAIGAAATRLPTDQGRIAVSLGNDGNSFDALGDLSGGDSGSATATLKLRTDKLLLGDGAVGVNTHGVVIDHVPLFSGTLLKHGVAMAAAKGYGGLELVNEDGTLVSLGDTSATPTPQAAFTSPASGSSVAQGASVAITGTATFPPPDARLPYYLHRDGCGTAADNPHMGTTPSDAAEGGDGCGDLLGAVGLVYEQIPLTTLPVLGDVGGGVFVDYPAVPDPDHDLALDTSKSIEAQIFFSGFVGEPTQVYHDLEGRLYSGSGATRTLVASGRIAEILPPTGEVDFTLSITGPSTLPANTPLTFELIEHESLGPMFVEYGGSHLSQIRLPLATAPANSVQVSVDDPAFGAANQLTVTGTTSWNATWNVGAATPTGTHTLYARAIQGTTVQSPPATLALTVTAAAAPHADFTWTANELAVQFNDTSTAGAAPITSWAWAFGDGGTSTAQDPSHTYAGDGTYLVTLTVTDGNGNHGTATHAVAVAHVVLWDVQVRILDAQGGQAVGWTTVVANAHTGDAGLWSYTWDPAPRPAPGDYTLQAALLRDGSTVATAHRNFTVVDHAPELNVPGPQSTNETQALHFVVSASDPDGDTVTLNATGLPAGASFDASTGAFDWTPTYDQADDYTVTFTAHDGRGGSDTATVAIHVNNVDRAPVLDTIADVTAAARTHIQFTVHAVDPDGDTVTYTADNLPLGATLNPVSGDFSWTPGKKQAGGYTVTFHASDGTLEDLQGVHFTITKN